MQTAMKAAPIPTGKMAAPTALHLLSPVYLVAVGLLLLNDFVLKHTMPGLITGKLSDFSGLFAFAVFWSVVFPRWIKSVHVIIGLAFAFWKSPAAESAIQGWNATMPFRIGRVVDYGDLLALTVLPVSMLYLRREWTTVAPRKAGAVAVAIVSLFAFTATSQLPVERGRILSRDGEYRAAIQQFDEHLKLDPQSGEAHYHRGLAKLKLGDTAGAEADFDRAASLDPKYRTR
jgi:tetratricopeptide (TPR) repeat protein